jgi:hypothetical protein
MQKPKALFYVFSCIVLLLAVYYIGVSSLIHKKSISEATIERKEMHHDKHYIYVKPVHENGEIKIYVEDSLTFNLIEEHKKYNLTFAWTGNDTPKLKAIGNPGETSKEHH